MPDKGKSKRHLTPYGKEVQKMYNNREISESHYIKLMKKRKCWTYE